MLVQVFPLCNFGIRLSLQWGMAVASAGVGDRAISSVAVGRSSSGGDT
jgi:hypothetical protein